MRNTIITMWELKDFYAGMRVNSSQHGVNGECIVGYLPSGGLNDRYTVISLADGACYYKGLSKQGIIDRLNQDEYVCQKALDKMNGVARD